jgi:hypothetical protein
LRSKSGKRFGQVAPPFKEWRVWGIRQQSPIGGSRRPDRPLLISSPRERHRRKPASGACVGNTLVAPTDSRLVCYAAS